MTLNPDPVRVPPITKGTRLRIAREWRGLSQDDLAGVLGKTRQTISNYEREFTPIGKLELNAWAVTTDTDVDWLKTGTETPELPDGGGSVTARYRLDVKPQTWGRTPRLERRTLSATGQERLVA